MFRFAPYLLKSLWRHRARTLLTVSGSAVGLFVFCIVGAVQDGMARLTSDEHARRTLVVFQENRFCPTTSRLPEDYARRIAGLPGVRDVLPLMVWTNNCRASLDAVVFNGVPAAQLRTARDLRLVAGSWDEFESRRDAALVGRQMAQRRKLAVGSQFTIGDVSVRIAGVFASASPSEENLIYTHLAFLQYTQGLNTAGLVTLHEVHLDEAADADRLAATIDEALRAGPVATTTRRKGAFQAGSLADLIDLIGFARWLGYACVGLVLALVATTAVMAVQDRVKEHAVLQTVGVRPDRVFRLVVAETLLICLAGGMLGTLLALGVLSWTGLSLGAEGVLIAFQPSWELAGLGAAVSLAVGLAAGIVPAWQAARAQIVPALRDA